MASLQPAVEHSQAQQRQEEATAILTAREWRNMDAADLDRSWAQIVDRLTLILASAQLGAARAGATYVSQMVDVQPDGQVNPQAWSGVASDGRPLDTLLYGAVVHAKTLIGHDYSPTQAVASGGDWLDMVTRTQVADASRGAAGVAIAARPQVGWVRMVNPPCCQRCAVLAGKYFKWNEGFKRHPRCDCRHVPAKDGEIPAGYTADIAPDQIKDLTRAQRQAIADGADTNQVINSHRGRSKDGMTTSEGTTRRGYASYVRRATGTAQETVSRSTGRRNVTRTQRRLTPEAIYRVSATREEAIRLLRENGYIVGNLSRIAAA